MSLRFVTSERGMPKLIDGGFMYVRDKVVQDTMYWKCEFLKSKHCRAQIHTRDGEIVSRWKTAHMSHTGDAGAVEAAETRSTLKCKTLASDHAPKVIVSDSLGTASQSAVVAYAGGELLLHCHQPIT